MLLVQEVPSSICRVWSCFIMVNNLEIMAQLGYGSTGSAYCRALGCPNKGAKIDVSGIKQDDITFYRFPRSRPEVYEKWVKAVGIKDFQPGCYWSLCNRHFTPDCFGEGNSQQRMLKPMAVPTLFQLPPLNLMHQVDTSAPYLQPRVFLRRVDDPEPPPKPSPPEEEAEKETEDIAMDVTMHDHRYMKVDRDPEWEIARFKKLLEELKDKVMSSSQRVKSLKISVSALKYQFQLEQENVNNTDQSR
ncbi:THAP domain-containing protein 1 [Elysia marginata]|uniref:THAP domain-containing protein 1 n=1 Tax=Elysia marginata TaxID=1093978 RepID=A0AAV4ET76_9GAST|nr:THAP domain-containing protein 1 [Elysia marginata]